MEDLKQVSNPPMLFRMWTWLFVGIGAVRLADWVYGGCVDTPAVLSGVGFLLMAPSARLGAVPREQLASQPHRRLLLACTWLGAVLVVASIVVRHL